MTSNATHAPEVTPSALAGIRVVEFGPYVALPLTGRILGSLGAEVIKVETNKVLDEMSFIPAWSRGAGQPEYQRGKRRITLDVRTEAGRDLMLEMVRISDVFMTNFRRNVLDRWGDRLPGDPEAAPGRDNHVGRPGLGATGRTTPTSLSGYWCSTCPGCH